MLRMMVLRNAEKWVVGAKDEVGTSIGG